MFSKYKDDILIRVNGKSEERKKVLEVVKKYYQFLQDAEEEERWAQERIDNCRSTNTGKDLNAAMLLLKKHDVRKNTQKNLPFIESDTLCQK